MRKGIKKDAVPDNEMANRHRSTRKQNTPPKVHLDHHEDADGILGIPVRIFYIFTIYIKARTSVCMTLARTIELIWMRMTRPAFFEHDIRLSLRDEMIF